MADTTAERPGPLARAFYLHGPTSAVAYQKRAMDSELQRYAGNMKSDFLLKAEKASEYADQATSPGDRRYWRNIADEFRFIASMTDQEATCRVESRASDG